MQNPRVSLKNRLCAGVCHNALWAGVINEQAIAARLKAQEEHEAKMKKNKSA